jgi:hypothetical protein
MLKITDKLNLLKMQHFLMEYAKFLQILSN